MLNQARLLRNENGRNLILANRMEQIVRKIDYREREMVKAYDMGLMSANEVERRKMTLIKALCSPTPRSLSPTKKFSNLTITKKSRRMERAKTFDSLLVIRQD